MSSYNRVTLLGNLTGDPEMRYMGDGTAIAGFNLAINERWKSKEGQQKERTDFIGVSAFGKQAELVGQYFTKGKPLMLEGKLVQEQWEDKQTGAKRSRTTVRLEKLVFLPRNAAEGQGSHSQSSSGSGSGIDHGARNASGQPSGAPFAGDDDDVPF